VAVAFLGHELKLEVPDPWRELAVAGAGKQAVADFWAEFARAPVDPVVTQLREVGERLGLNGWGYMQLSRALAEALHGPGRTAVAMTWGLLLKSGYDARLGFADGRLLLLYRPQEKLYGTPYFELDGRRYYVEGNESEELPRLHTYEADYQGADTQLKVAMRQPPKAGGRQQERELTFRFDGQTQHFTVPVQPALLDYLRQVPQLAVERYFGTHSHTRLNEALVTPLRQASADMDRVERVNFLLRFVQTAFDYQTDQEQFGREDYLYPEETVAYPASDCEDRSVLFAYLVRQVLGLEVAVLDYPGHVATAVDLDEGRGVRVTVDGRELMVADPTYINARAGMVMPDFRGERPRVVPLWEG